MHQEVSDKLYILHKFLLQFYNSNYNWNKISFQFLEKYIF